MKKKLIVPEHKIVNGSPVINLSKFTLKLLYCSLVRSHLEYGWVILAELPWSGQCTMIERVQHWFVRRVSYYTNEPMSVFNHDYCPLLNTLGLLTLASRRCMFDLTFIFNVINGCIDPSDIRALFGLCVPARNLRCSQPFHISFHRTLYSKYQPLNRLCLLANEFSSSLDFFGVSHSSFKNKLIVQLTV